MLPKDVATLLLLVAGSCCLSSGSPLEPNVLFFSRDGVPPEVAMGYADNSLVLECGATGSPQPTIHWLFNGARIPQGFSTSVFDDEPQYELVPSENQLAEELQFGSTKSKLYIDCLTPAHAGVYTCVAQTPVKRMTTVTTLRVDSSAAVGAQSEMCLSQRRVLPARITMWTNMRVEYEGATVQLFCRADGSPTRKITWIKENGDLINPAQNSRYKVLKNGDLVIKNIAWATDMGGYTCLAENEAGEDRASTFLYPTAP